MADTIMVQAEMEVMAWVTPNLVHFVANHESTKALPAAIEDVDPRVIDALAQTWLDHLYARLNRESPFKKVGP